jgi:hypothetical protein
MSDACPTLKVMNESTLLIRQTKEIMITAAGSLYIIIDMAPNFFAHRFLQDAKKHSIHA